MSLKRGRVTNLSECAGPVTSVSLSVLINLQIPVEPCVGAVSAFLQRAVITDR